MAGFVTWEKVGGEEALPTSLLHEGGEGLIANGWRSESNGLDVREAARLGRMQQVQSAELSNPTP